MAELKAYGLDATGYEFLQEDCENGVRDYFETSIDCGGNFCPTLGPTGRCLEGEYCEKNRDCLSEECVENSCTSPPGYVNGEFTASATNVSLISSRFDSSSIPKLSVTTEVGLITQLCEDENCHSILGEVDHTEEQMVLSPDSGLPMETIHFMFVSPINAIMADLWANPFYKIYSSKIKLIINECSCFLLMDV